MSQSDSSLSSLSSHRLTPFSKSTCILSPLGLSFGFLFVLTTIEGSFKPQRWAEFFHKPRSRRPQMANDCKCLDGGIRVLDNPTGFGVRALVASELRRRFQLSSISGQDRNLNARCIITIGQV